MTRALAPSSILAYEATLALAFTGQEPGPETLDVRRVAKWSNSSLNQLKCAVRWYRKSKGLAPKISALEDLLAPKYVIEKQVFTPSEFEIEKLEKIAQTKVAAHRSCILLLLYLGLRAEEYFSLTRRQVERAISTKLLTFRRKGGREASLDSTKVQGLLEDLLVIPAYQQERFGVKARPKKWEILGEVYSTGKPKSQYAIIRKIVMKACKDAGLSETSPHKLRHAFATRMNRDGASPFVIQAALNHKNIVTTQRYVHAGSAEVAKFMRGPGEKK